MALNIGDFKDIVEKDIVCETAQTYEFFCKIGLPVRRLDTKPDIFYISDIKCFSYTSFRDVEVFENDLLFDLEPGLYSSVYYMNKTRKNGEDTLYVVDENGEIKGTMVYSEEGRSTTSSA